MRGKLSSILMFDAEEHIVILRLLICSLGLRERVMNFADLLKFLLVVIKANRVENSFVLS